jgi:putative Holliday junction resolvase
VQQKQTINGSANADDFSLLPESGRIIAIDPGTIRCGVAVCDEMRVTTRPLTVIKRESWKKLLAAVQHFVSEYDAGALVVGLPLESDGAENAMTAEARSMARKFGLSLTVPVYLQDERVTSYEAKSRLWERGVSLRDARKQVDSEAAAIILGDFLDRVPGAR